MKTPAPVGPLVLAGQGRVDEAIGEFKKSDRAAAAILAGTYNAIGRSLLHAARYARSQAAFTKVDRAAA